MFFMFFMVIIKSVELGGQAFLIVVIALARGQGDVPKKIRNSRRDAEAQRTENGGRGTEGRTSG
jgi:hypothetical protein